MSAHQNPPKRPRLSLQIKTIANGLNLRGSRTVAAAVDQTSPTAFNTLSNVYASAIDRATPVTAINTTQPLKIRTQNLTQGQHGSQSKTQAQTQTPFALAYPETPLTAQPLSPAVAAQSVHFPSTMTATPPLSSGPVDENDTRPFSFSAADTAGAPSSSASRSASSQPDTTTTTTPSAPHPPASASATPTGGPTTRRRAAAMTLSVPRSSSSSSAASKASCIGLPYVRNRSLHSILRNSPLPPPSARTPVSPRRQSLRLAEKAARRVGYESPIERVITTNQYVRSHIDLLAEEDASPASSTASPATATATEAQAQAQGQEGGGAAVLDVAMAYTGDETRDGGATPGPFEEMRRRMAGLATRTPTSPGGSGSGSGSPAGVRKRKRRDGGGGSKRRWVWTIGTQDDDLDDREVGGALAAIRAAARAQGDAQACGAPATAPASAPASIATATTATTPAGDSAPPAVRQAVEAPSPMEVLTPSIEVSDEVDAEAEGAGAGQEDVVMCGSEAGEPVGLRPGDVDVDVDVDMVTPTVTRKGHQCYLGPARQESEGLFNSETGTRRDTPIPADLVPAERRG